MVAHAQKLTKNTGILNLGKIRSAKTKNPIDFWKNAVRCALCDRPLAKNKNRLEYWFLINGQRYKEKLDIELSIALRKDTIVQQVCLNCVENTE